MVGGIRKDGRKVFWHVRNNASGAHFFLEEKFIDFKECKNLKGTIINLLGCGALIGVIYFIASFIPDKYIRHLFRNTLLGFSASYLYPLLASKLGILKKNEKN